MAGPALHKWPLAANLYARSATLRNLPSLYFCERHEFIFLTVPFTLHLFKSRGKGQHHHPTLEAIPLIVRC